MSRQTEVYPTAQVCPGLLQSSGGTGHRELRGKYFQVRQSSYFIEPCHTYPVTVVHVLWSPVVKGPLKFDFTMCLQLSLMGYFCVYLTLRKIAI